MTYQIRIRHDAERDLERLYRWYEAQADGLGRRLLNELENAYSVLDEKPFIYADIYQGIRRVVLRKYPVGVFYKVVDDVIHIIAVDHLASAPQLWRDRE